MDAFELFKADGAATGIWACGKCKFIVHGYDEPAKGRAEECCTPGKCRECGREKQEADKLYSLCRLCREKERELRYLEQMAAAEKLDTWDGWVYWEGFGSKDGFFYSLNDLLEWHADERHFRSDCPVLPEFVFCCKPIPFCKADIEDIIERCTEDSFEDAADQIEGRKELEAALEAFNAANVGLVSYEPDWKHAVRVAPPSAPGREGQPGPKGEQ
jgi:hypothetical protein